MPHVGATQFSLALCCFRLTTKSCTARLFPLSAFKLKCNKQYTTHIPLDAMWHNYKCIGICIKMMGNSTRVGQMKKAATKEVN